MRHITTALKIFPAGHFQISVVIDGVELLWHGQNTTTLDGHDKELRREVTDLHAEIVHRVIGNGLPGPLTPDETLRLHADLMQLRQRTRYHSHLTNERG